MLIPIKPFSLNDLPGRIDADMHVLAWCTDSGGVRWFFTQSSTGLSQCLDGGGDFSSDYSGVTSGKSLESAFEWFRHTNGARDCKLVVVRKIFHTVNNWDSYNLCQVFDREGNLLGCYIKSDETEVSLPAYLNLDSSRRQVVSFKEIAESISHEDFQIVGAVA